MRFLSELAGTLRSSFRIGRATFKSSGLTADRELILSDKSGVVMLVSDIGAGMPQKIETLWSGSIGSNGIPLTLSAPVAVGDLLFLRHGDAVRVVSHPLVVTEGLMTSGRTAYWSFSGGGFTGLTYNNPSQFTTNGFTAGYAITEIYRSKAGLSP